MNQMSERDMQQHVTVLGWLLIVANAAFLVIGVSVFALLAGIGAISGDQQAMVVLGLVATFVAVVMMVISLPGIIAGYGLLRRKTWGRVLAIVVAALNLMNFPLGTLLGVYALYVLLQQAASDYFANIRTA